MMMTQEEVQMAKELHFEVISFLTDPPQEGAPPSPVRKYAIASLDETEAMANSCDFRACKKLCKSEQETVSDVGLGV